MPRQNIPRILVPNDGISLKNVDKAFGMAHPRALMSESGADLVILVPSYNAVPDLPQGYGDLSSLKTKRQANASFGVKVRVERYDSVGTGADNEIYLAIYPDLYSGHEFDRLNDIESAHAIFLVPASHDTGRLWKRVWNPTLTSKAYDSSLHQELPDDLAGELRNLPSSLTGIHEQSDLETKLPDLRKKFPNLTRDEIEIWSTQHGYMHKDRSFILKTWDKG